MDWVEVVGALAAVVVAIIVSSVWFFVQRARLRMEVDL